jgi:signal transduction histidine kinase
MGILAFALIAVLVAGGLGWVTLAALRLEREQVDMRVENELGTKIRLALWRLDSRVYSLLAVEANRAYHHYAVDVTASVFKSNQTVPAMDVLELLPAAGSADPSWMRRHFLVVRKSDWGSTHNLLEVLVQRLGILKQRTSTVRDAVADQFLDALCNDRNVKKLLTPDSRPENQLTGNPANPFGANTLQLNAGDSSFLNNNNDAPNSSPQSKFDKDTASRYNRAQVEMTQAAQAPGINNFKVADPKQVLAILGPLVPLWVQGGSEQRLVVTRQVQMGEKLACQVTLLDWVELQQELAEEVRDLLPNMRLVAMREGDAPAPERAMTALPVELEPGLTLPPMLTTLWTPLRVGLLLAWAAALVALLAVWLGGLSLLNLSERRIRFVSAVTHELRTPLTTLRLYLDMLASGMVHEEKQKNDYIQTLNTEADRLNRLVGNVLDFSRLENQRPRLEQAAVALGELLAQVQATWQSRCQNAGKELVIENDWGPDVVLFTDVKLVNQIVGNLIDNACKYSQGAADRRIWVRARCSEKNQLVLEVEDRGSGVPAEERHSIFRPFRRGQSEHLAVGGVGLGLALALRWARLLGGKLTLRPAAEKAGACFRVELPCLAS